MKSIIVTIILFMSPLAFGQMTVTVSIPPQKYIAEKIGGQNILVNVMVPDNSDPHTFSPKSNQIKMLMNSKLYLGIGFPFEDSILPGLARNYKDLTIVMTNQNVEMIEDHHSHGGHSHEHLDPHVWTSPRQMQLIARNTYDSFVKVDPGNKNSYLKNYEEFSTILTEMDTKFENLFANNKINKSFLVYHPAFGYLARDYGLTQYAVEQDGKAPKPRELQKIIETVRKENIKLFITNPRQSEQPAHTVAWELSLETVPVDILQENWIDMMEELYRAFHNSGDK